MNNPTDSTALQPDDYKTDAEPTHFAKVLEIFTKPAKTFEQMSKFPPRTIDWFLPVLILSVLIIITPYVLINNNSIYYQVKQQQIERNQKTFNKMVEKEIMIREQADDKIIKMKFRMSDSFIADFLISHIIWSLFLLFIIYFVIAGFYFFIVTRVLKGEGEYRHVLVAAGLASYFIIVSRVLVTVLIFILGKPIQDISSGQF